MEHRIRLTQLAQQSWLQWVCGSMIILLLVMVMTQGMLLRSIKQQRVVITPVWIHQPMWVSDSAVSTEYLSQMATVLLSLRFNVTSETVHSQHRGLLRYVDPTAYALVKSVLSRESQRLRQHQISSVFYPHRMHIDTRALSVITDGELVWLMGNLPTARYPKRYCLSFSISAAGIHLTQFNEIQGGQHV